MNKIYYVYGLVDPRDGLIKYIGMSENLSNRYLNHLSGFRTGKQLKDKWIQYLDLLDLKPSLVVLDLFETKKKAEKREKQLIKYYAKKHIIYNTKANDFYKGMTLVVAGEFLTANPLYETIIKSIKL